MLTLRRSSTLQLTTYSSNYTYQPRALVLLVYSTQILPGPESGRGRSSAVVPD
jgi:hypothetical protein